ncbi:MAG: TonB-dependent receptor [Emcibacter sp.]|nr:TonB-dependent receptor [Emcibacter sp.]
MTKIFKRHGHNLMLGTSATVILLSSGYYAQAQEKKLVLEEIVVTATKRAESVQDVPLSVTAFDAAFTERVNLDDVKDLVKFAPGMAGDSKDSFIDYINIRGISTNDFGVGGDPSVGFFKNGLYQGRNGVVVTSMFDMARAEVLRGPQGFLFGRNAISGAISLYTARPDFNEVSGYVSAGAGERNHFEAEGAINLPVSDKLAFRFAAYHSEEDGYLFNYARPDAPKEGWHDKSAFRATVGYQNENFDATLMFEYENRKLSGSTYRTFNDDEILPFLQSVAGDLAVPRGNKGDIDSDMGLGNHDRGEVTSFSAELNWDLEFAKLTSLTGYKDHTYSYAEDFDGMALNFNNYGQEQDGNYFEQELRLTSQSDSKLSWYAGVSYYKENINAAFSNTGNEDVMCQAYYYYSCSEVFAYYDWGDFTANPAGLVEDNIIDGAYHGWGAYLDLSYAATEKLEVGAGIRYTKDTKKFGINILPVESDLGPFFMFGVTTDGFLTTEKSWNDFTPRFYARYHVNDDMMVYGNITKGYKAGGFGSFAVILGPDGTDDDLLALPGATPNDFNPETVWSYEVGLKADMMDKRVRMDVAAYHYKYTDLQLNYFDSGSRVENVGQVKAYGIEATLQAIVSENIDLFMSTSYNDNEIKDADIIAEGSDGNRLGGSPSFTFAALLSFHMPVGQNGEINASADIKAQSKTFGGIENLVAAQNNGWSDVSLRMGYESYAGWEVTLYLENVFNSRYFDGTGEGGGSFPHHGFGISVPRTFGGKVRYNF